MTVLQSVVNLSSQDMTFIKRKKNDLVEVSFVEKKTDKSLYIRHLITEDINREYSLTQDNYNVKTPGLQEFYDGKNKVFDAVYNTVTDTLHLSFKTQKQVNFFIDIDVTNCSIHAEGNVCIDNQMQIKKHLVIEAYGLCSFSEITCLGDVGLDIKQGLSIYSPIKTVNYKAHVGFYQNKSSLIVEEFCDISCQAYQQTKTSKTQLNALRFVSEQSLISGVFKVDGKCFISSNHLMLGQDNHVSSIDLKGEHYVHAIQCTLKGETSVSLGFDFISSGCQKKKSFSIDGVLIINESASLTLVNTDAIINKIENNGCFLIDDAQLSIKYFNQRGDFTSNLSGVYVLKEYLADKQSISTVTQSTFSALHMTLITGSFSVNNSEWLCSDLCVSNASVRIDGKSDTSFGSVMGTEHASVLCLKDSAMTIVKGALFYGAFSSMNSTVKADKITVYHQLVLAKSKISVLNDFQCHGVFKATDSDIHARDTVVNADVFFDDLIIQCPSIHLESQKATVKNSIFNSIDFTITGSNNAKDVIFTDSHLSAKTFVFLNCNYFKNATLIGFDDATVRHRIEGTLTLDDSKFITPSQHHYLGNKSIKIIGNTFISGSRAYSETNLSFDGADVHYDSLSLDNGATLTATNSQVHITEDIFAFEGGIEIDSASVVTAKHMTLESRSSLKLTGNSVLAIRETTVTLEGSNIQSDKSRMVSQSFIILGSVALSESLLSAEELHVYDSFSATDKTMVSVQQSITMANSAKIALKESMLSASDIEVFGEIALDDSILKAESGINLWSQSETQVKGNTVLLAENVLIRGQISSDDLFDTFDA